MNNYILILIVLLLIVILLILARKEEKRKSDEELIEKQDEIKEKLFQISKELSENILNVRNQINKEVADTLRKTESVVFDQISKTISTLSTTDTNIQKKMEGLRQQLHSTLTDTVKNLLSTVDSSTSHLTRNIDGKLTQIDKRLADTSGLMSKLNLQLGELKKTTDEVQKIGNSIKEALTTPKLQGQTGELFLENMLRDNLPRETYRIQYSLSPSDRVDAIIKIDEKLIPVDAKFPLDAYRKMINSEGDDYERAKGEFIRSVKNHIDRVSKYIQPEKGTFDFAFMYIPSEPIFYSLLICEDKGTSLFNYAWSTKRVLPVSPQSLFAYLRMVLLGLKGKTIEKNASYILKSVEGLVKTLENLRTYFDKASRQLKYTSSNFEEVKNYLDKFESEFKSLARFKTLPEKSEREISDTES